jgi:hypothetical protein
MRQKGRSLIIIGMVHPDLEGAPICRLAPTPEFPLAYLVAFLHAVFRSISGGDGIRHN